MNGKWHESHFTCEYCGKSLANEPFIKKNGKPYCKPCNTKLKNKQQRAYEVCDKCKNPLSSDKIIFNNQKLHAYHFTCTACKITLSSSNCKEFESRLYCIKDYERLLNLNANCFACKQQITGRSVNAMGKYFHPDHFVCSKCEKPFSAESFFEYEGKPLCEYHFNEAKGDLCGLCYEPASGGLGTVTALGRKWCQDHFQCVGCQINIMEAKIRFSEWDSKPICVNCWGMLPLDIRRVFNQYSSFEKKASEELGARKQKEEAAAVVKSTGTLNRAK